MSNVICDVKQEGYTIPISVKLVNAGRLNGEFGEPNYPKGTGEMNSRMRSEDNNTTVYPYVDISFICLTRFSMQHQNYKFKSS